MLKALLRVSYFKAIMMIIIDGATAAGVDDVDYNDDEDFQNLIVN